LIVIEITAGGHMTLDFSLVKKSFEDEVIAKEVYKFLSKKVGEHFKDDFIKLSEMEQRHADIWRQFAEEKFNKKLKVGLGLKLKIFLYKLASVILPLIFIINYLELGEKLAADEYVKLMRALDGDEKAVNMVKGIIVDELMHEHVLLNMIINAKTDISRVKDAIYGMTDSLVEILALVIGLASVINDPLTIGLAGLIAAVGGTFSMTAGAYLSTKSQKDLYEGSLRDLEIKEMIDPSFLERDLKNALIEKGLGERDAGELVNIIKQNPTALRELTKHLAIEEEPDDPSSAAKTTGIYYVLGALPAILPFFIGSMFPISTINIAVIAVVLSAIVSFLAGAFTSILSGLSVRKEAVQNMIIVIGASLATYTIGTIAKILLGISV